MLRNSRIVFTVLTAASFAIALGGMLSGCKGNQQLQQQVADMDAKLADSQKRITTLEGELKKESFELNQLKGLVTKLGNVTVDLQRAEEERQKAAAEAKTKAATKKPAAAKKAAPSKGKKKH
jgi:chromosome segregation ATPase